MGASNIKVEVAYATPEKQKIVVLELPVGCTMYEAVVQSNLVEEFPQIDVDTDKMGLFGKAVKNPKDHQLVNGDRVEIYRPLLIDPKQARLNRAAKK